MGDDDQDIVPSIKSAHLSDAVLALLDIVGAGGGCFEEGLTRGDIGCSGAGRRFVEAMDGDEETAGANGRMQAGERRRRDYGGEGEGG